MFEGEGVTVGGWDRRLPLKRGLRKTTFSVETNLEPQGYDFYEYHLNKGGQIHCGVSR